MLPLASFDLPGCGGTVRANDSVCEEVLHREPSGGGLHWWIQTHKHGLGTAQARTAVAKAAQVTADEVACAGFRDRRGQSVQWFSVSQERCEHPGALRRAGTQGRMKVLQVLAHGKPVDERAVVRLRWGLRIRGAGGAFREARAIMDRLRQAGLPNYHRLEERGRDRAKWGRLIAQGKNLPRAVHDSGEHPLACLDACRQSLFDRWLAGRVTAGLLATVVPGDLIETTAGGIETVSDPAHVGLRLSSWEASVTGPLFGKGLLIPEGDPAVREAAILEGAGLTTLGFQRLSGSRRPARVQPTKVMVDRDGSDVIISCELPVDARIDNLLAELVRSEDPTGPAEDSEPVV